MPTAGRTVPPNHASRVRIIGGRHRGRTVRFPDAPGLRPTPDRVRETLFNWLGQDMTGWRVLDAFAGSGALGFEAASRGAAAVVLLESEPKLVALLKAAQQRLQAATLRIERADALAWMAAAPRASFDLVLLDPPFDAGLFEQALTAAAPLVVAGGFVYLESDRPIDEALLPGLGLRLHRAGRAGMVHFHLLQRAAS